VILNKRDRFLDADRAAILAKLKERLAGIVSAEDVICVAASPRPVPLKIRGTDGNIEPFWNLNNRNSVTSRSESPPFSRKKATPACR